MNRERFIRQRRGDWKQLESLLATMKNTRMAHWSGRDVTKLSQLYRSVCYDLSLVQSREWGLRLEQYLNDLVAQGHNCLYRSPPRSLNTVLEFLGEGFPRLVRARRHFFYVALALFVVPFLATMTLTAYDPLIGERFVPKDMLETSSENYSGDLYQRTDDHYGDERSGMAGFYIQHNVGIAFKTFAFGAFFGIGSVILLLFNGLSIGATTGYLISEGRADQFFSFAISHGSFELTAIVIAGAAGLLLGWGMIHPGEMTRRESLRVHGIDAVQLACGAGVMLFIAAMIEGYFSPMSSSTVPMPLKYSVGTLMWILVAAYLLRGGSGVSGSADSLPRESSR